MSRRLLPALTAGLFLLGAIRALAQAEPSPPAPAAGEPAPLERLTFDEAVRRAGERNPTVGQAAQAILRAQALRDQ
ncbi:MAG TPA: hypothetical protein VI669_10735, partial [Vicinamibacteria bacterium]